MNRVEILKGPQNTLFGLNTTGGTVSYFSNKPEIGAGTTGSIEARLGNYSSSYVSGAIGFDMGANSAARIAGFWDKSDGAFDSVYDGRDFGDDDTKGFRAQFLWSPRIARTSCSMSTWAKAKTTAQSTRC